MFPYLNDPTPQKKHPKTRLYNGPKLPRPAHGYSPAELAPFDIFIGAH